MKVRLMLSRVLKLFLIVAFLGSFHLRAQATENGLSNYRLGSGDKISVTVFNEKELSLEKVRLSDAGTISYPMLGELKVLDMTPAQLENLIASQLKGRYLVDPKVTVTIDEYRAFYVIGFVKSPGGFPFQPGLSVRKAISLAGGFQERANRDRIVIIHDGDNTPHRVGLDAPVGPGDTLTVEESFF